MRSQGQAWKISVLTPPRLGNPTAASIRYHDEYLSGERGLQQLTNRWNRIQAVVALLKQKLTARWFDRTLAGWQLGPSNRQPSLQEAAGKLLFPELYGYAIPPKSGHRTAVGESVRWDVDYSDAEFPENLREIRNSGTMLRDFEECLDLWRFAYNWDEFWANRIPGSGA